ncbi:conserved hypothetical protein [anaerobic digester metagenome]|jgi:hypothetical protein|uniref:Lipoprotein n=1 Tax=anaerobic digester metagenome TaxID=1263854 RepID=A0A485LZA7_9ZZZZ|nr:hypothetical protein [Pseudomonadota bacterium]
MRRGLFLLVIMGLFLYGCKTIHTSVVMFDEAAIYEPSQRVEILSKPPAKAYKAIALLETYGPRFTLVPDLLADMRLEAMKIGANAIIPGEQGEIPHKRQIMYNPILGGYQGTGGGSSPTIQGVAIRYVE